MTIREQNGAAPWLRNVRDWPIVAIRYLLEERITDGPHETPEFIDEGCPFISVDGIQNGELTFQNCRFISEEQHREFREKAAPKVGDILFGKAASTGKIARIKTDKEFSIWSPLALLRPNRTKLLSAYFEYALKSPMAQAQVDILITTNTQNNISMDAIPRIRIPVPSLPEQQRISAYLDNETIRIDALIVAKERLLELLAQKRRALIARAVTRGLNPDVPVRDSGIPWLGQIPAHWAIMKLKHVAFLKSGDAITSDSITESGEYPVYGGNGIRGYTSSFTHNGDYVLIGRQGALCGNINIASGRFWASEHAVVVHVQGENDFNWLGELLQIMNLNQYSQSAAQPGLAVGFVANLQVPIPPLPEQRLIVAHIRRETAKLDALRQAAERTIGLLRERRAALIAAAVTGKIKSLS